MNSNMEELDLNEMENVNGAGLLDWVVVHIGVPVVRALNDLKDKSGGIIKEGTELLQSIH